MDLSDQERKAALMIKALAESIPDGIRKKIARLGERLTLYGVAVCLEDDKVVFRAVNAGVVSSDEVSLSEAAGRVVQEAGGSLVLIDQGWRKEEARVASLPE